MPAEPALRPLCNIQLCFAASRPEAASDVLSSKSVRPIVSDYVVKFRDPRLNCCREIWLQTIKLVNQSLRRHSWGIGRQQYCARNSGPEPISPTVSICIQFLWRLLPYRGASSRYHSMQSFVEQNLFCMPPIGLALIWSGELGNSNFGGLYIDFRNIEGWIGSCTNLNLAKIYNNSQSRQGSTWMCISTTASIC